jgi:hypothetical protein
MAAASATLSVACSKSSEVSRVVTLHAPAACAPSAGASAIFSPFGDFQPPAATPPSVAIASTGTPLSGLPLDTLELLANVSDPTGTPWVAHGLVPSAGNLDLLVLPSGTPCSLTDPTEAVTGAMIGAIDGAHLLIAGGALAAGGVPNTSVIDLAKGTVTSLPIGLLVPRTEATITPWSGGAIVAGGVSPSSSNMFAASFEVYSSASGDFSSGQTYPLSQARRSHGAAVLSSGKTLLVGGVNQAGQVLSTMEVIDATATPPNAATGGLGALAVPRINPSVMRLASGEILVAGGVDASGQPVSTLEWFPSNAGPSVRPTAQLVTSTHSAFLPLAAGGALAVIPPPPGTSSPSQNVWVISPSGVLEAATPVTDTLTTIALVDGPEQAPALWTGSRWLVWQPWSGSFAPLSSTAGVAGPSSDPVATAEPGLAAWLDGTTVHAFRFGTPRGPYASTPSSSPLLYTDTHFTGPDQLVTTGAAGLIQFSSATGLALAYGTSVFLTDATFLSFTLDAQTPGGNVPAIVLRDDAGNETLLAPPACSIPSGNQIHIVRSGATIQMTVDQGGAVTCNTSGLAAGTRVSIGVRGASMSAASVISQVVVVRT